MSLSNLSQVLVRNIDLLECQKAILVNFPVDDLYREWLADFHDTKLHYFTNNKLSANLLSKIDNRAVTSSFGSHYQGNDKFDLALIAFPKSKAELAYSLAMLAPNLTTNARILFVGENKGGIKSVAKLGKDYLTYCNKVDSARHCSLFLAELQTGQYSFSIDDWFHIYPLNIAGIELNIAALPGVFSQQGLDKGTKVLLENLPTSYSGKILDFGCGAGVIGAVLAKKFTNISILGIDISALAIASTEKTLQINELTGQAIASDGLTMVNERYDHIVSNPPFHQGLKTHYAATETFLKQSKEYLNPKGQLTIVANSFLKYLPIIQTNFKITNTPTSKSSFNIYHASKN
ncbi:methyltransferase [Thalassotalea sp. M1531]|uniref:Ribosomal RNA small subunit methyltransferase C n=1 Tax=Thalassotalea algicola TaxID=2716224 RepID=A0A7Y0L9H9_9GAMM|nr:methyltransferase [Thalassotalea algicola]NMP30326.1 methyltransferase [Thalassotalea algicola]